MNDDLMDAEEASALLFMTMSAFNDLVCNARKGFPKAVVTQKISKQENGKFNGVIRYFDRKEALAWIEKNTPFNNLACQRFLRSPRIKFAKLKEVANG